RVDLEGRVAERLVGDGREGDAVGRLRDGVRAGAVVVDDVEAAGREAGTAADWIRARVRRCRGRRRAGEAAGDTSRRGGRAVGDRGRAGREAGQPRGGPEAAGGVDGDRQERRGHDVAAAGGAHEGGRLRAGG